MNNSNNAEFAAKEIKTATDTGGIAAGYSTLLAESQSMSKPQQQDLAKDLVKDGLLPSLSLGYLDADMKAKGLSSIDQSGVDSLKASADKSGSPIQAALADAVGSEFKGAAEVRGDKNSAPAIYADKVDDALNASKTGTTPPETASSDSASSSTAPKTEQVQNGDSYWSVAERALGFNDKKPLDQKQDTETFNLMKDLQAENGNAVLQPGDVVAIQAGDLPASATPGKPATKPDTDSGATTGSHESTPAKPAAGPTETPITEHGAPRPITPASNSDTTTPSTAEATPPYHGTTGVVASALAFRQEQAADAQAKALAAEHPAAPYHGMTGVVASDLAFKAEQAAAAAPDAPASTTASNDDSTTGAAASAAWTRAHDKA